MLKNLGIPMKDQAAYQIIARKYRPQTFASVVGQEPIVTTLKNALRFKRLAHAYLFCGFKGTGKTSIARVFAKALNCTQLTADQEPCNTCPSCLEVMQGRSLDVLEIDGASNRGIDDIRQINETVGYASTAGKYKIYIIDEVHMLTKEAFNALLKTLEEPPPNVKFFFATTEPHKVLSTIASRCQRFDLSRIPAALISSKLTQIAEELNVQADAEALHLIAHFSEGCLRDAESLFDQVICSADGKISAEHVASVLGRVSHATVFKLDDAIWSGTLSFAFDLAEELIASGKEVAPFIDLLMEHFRLILLLKMRPTAPLPSFLNAEQQKHYSMASARYPEENCLYILDLLIQASQQMAKTPFKRVHLEMVLLNLIRSPFRISIDTLAKRLIKLEHGVPSLPKVEQLKSSSAQTEVSREVSPPPAPKIEKKLPVPEKVESPAPLQAEAVKDSAPTPVPETTLPQHRYDTLTRFAAVELEGSLGR
jgi:DNA polymerase-3 subunit gamma/tau